MQAEPASRKIMKRRRPWIRGVVQGLFFALVAGAMLRAYLAEQGLAVPWLPSGSLHALCPFGGVVSLYSVLTTGTLVQKIHSSSLILMFGSLGLAVLAGPVVCGWVCPFGTFQEWLAKLGRRLLGKRYGRILPRGVDRWLRLLRYVLLALVIYNTAASARLVFQAVDPYFALFNFWTGEVALAAYAILGLTILLSMVVERPWCRYACPYGAFLGLSNRIRLFRLKRKEATCIHCSACDKACPMGIPVSQRDAVRDLSCISCLKCTSEEACPVPDTVVLEAGRSEGA